MDAKGIFLGVIVALAAAAGCRRPVERLEWPTMGTVAAVQTRGNAGLVAAADLTRSVFASVEKTLNAHDPASEIRQLAAEDEATILARCSPDVRVCYRAAFALSRETGGAFNPRWRGPETMDLGAIAKGFAVDRAAEDLRAQEGTGDVLVDLGGNLEAVRGEWRVGIAGSDRTVTLYPGDACATSAEYYRGKHVKDGRTGGEVTNGVWSVTVIARASASTGDFAPGTLADGLSTALFVLGREEGERLLRRFPGTEAIWIDGPGSGCDRIESDR